MADVLALTLGIALNIGLTWAVLRYDLARLDEKSLGRSWSDPSRWVAIVAFGPFCLPFHFAKTRRSVVGLLLGIGATALVLGAMVLVDLALQSLFG